MQKYLKTLNITARVSKEPLQDTNNHPNQAAERSIATARALGMIYSMGYRHATTVYGSERDVRINDYCNRQVARDRDKLELVRYSPALTSKDFTREPTDITLVDALRAAQAILMVDVYETCINGPAPLSPQIIADLLAMMPESYGGTRLVWVGRKYYGDCDVVANEGAWVRKTDAHGNPKIISRSSYEDPIEYSNDPLDWMWTSSSAQVAVRQAPAYLSWTVRKTVGSVVVVSFNLTLGALIETSPSGGLYPFVQNLVTVKCPAQTSLTGWWVQYLCLVPSLFRKFLPLEEEIQVYKPLLDIVRDSLAQKKFNQTNYVQAGQTLIAALKRPEIKAFYDLFPRMRPNQNQNSLVWGIMLLDLANRQSTNLLVTELYGAAMALVNDLQTKIGQPPSQPPKWASVFSTFVFVLSFYVVYRILRPRKQVSNPAQGAWVFSYPANLFVPKRAIPSDNKLISLIPGHILDLQDVLREEVTKKLFEGVHPACYHFFGFGEFAYYSYKFAPVYGWKTAVALRIGPLLMHTYGQSLSFWKRVGLHFLWNVAASPLYVMWLNRWFPHISLLSPKVVVGKFPTKWALLGLAGLTGLLALRTLCRSWFNKPRDVYLDWKSKYFYGPWSDRAVDDDPNSDLSPIRDPRVPEQVSDLPMTSDQLSDLYSDEKVKNPEHLLVISGKAVPDYKDLTYFYHILPTNVPGFVPKSCALNTQIAVAHRLLKPPPLTPDLQEQGWLRVRRRWGNELLSFIPQRVDLRAEWADIVDDWVLHFRSTKKRQFYRAIVEELKKEELNYNLPKHTPLFVKHDEMLMQQSEGYYVLKPRIIANVDPKYQARMGPYVYRAKERFAECFHISNPALNIVDYNHGAIAPTWFHMSTGGGMSDAQLSGWMFNVLNRVYVSPDETGFVILACGDDSLVAYCSPDAKIQFFEGDASMFDQSIGKGPLRWEHRFLFQLGLTNRMADSLFDMHSLPYHVRPGKHDHDQPLLVLSRINRLMRDTGSAQTYLGNTIVMLSSWYFVLREIQRSRKSWEKFHSDQSVDLIKTKFLKLGFSMKMSTTDNPLCVTFLKGMWYDVGDELCWGPLPSRILKMGKTLRDPRSMYCTSDYSTAGELYLSDVASSYSVFLQVPILRAFVKRFKLNHKAHHQEAEIPEYSTQASGNFSDIVTDEQLFHNLSLRYGIGPDDIRRVERLIERAQPFNFMRDPVFQRLATVDYR